MFNETSTETVDLKTIIKEIKRNKEVDSVYLFGSRAFKTNSERSDFDILLVGSVSPDFINAIYSKYEYLDLFVKDSDFVAHSIISGSTINTNNKPLIEQLCAVLLWSKTEGFVNKDFYKQRHYFMQRHFPSARPYPKEFNAFKVKLNDPTLPDEARFCFQEALCDFVNECYISCISLIGLGCESILIELCKSYEKRYLSLFPTTTDFESDVINAINAKTRLVNLEAKFVSTNEKQYIRNEHIGIILDETLKFFDIIRSYRNNADHPLGFTISKEQSLIAISQLDLHLLNICKLINHYRSNYR